MYLDFAEDQARRKKTMHMADWVQRLDAFLQFNERNVLTHAGKVTHQLAEAHAHGQFEQYDAERRRVAAAQPSSDFDRAIKEVVRLTASALQGEIVAKTKTKKAVIQRRKKDGRE